MKEVFTGRKQYDTLLHTENVATDMLTNITLYFATFLSQLQTDGIVIVKTKQAILVAIYKAPLQAAETTPIVEGLADYLISVGY